MECLFFNIQNLSSTKYCAFRLTAVWENDHGCQTLLFKITFFCSSNIKISLTKFRLKMWQQPSSQLSLSIDQRDCYLEFFFQPPAVLSIFIFPYFLSRNYSTNSNFCQAFQQSFGKIDDFGLSSSSCPFPSEGKQGLFGLQFSSSPFIRHTD